MLHTPLLKNCFCQGCFGVLSNDIWGKMIDNWDNRSFLTTFLVEVDSVSNVLAVTIHFDEWTFERPISWKMENTTRRIITDDELFAGSIVLYCRWLISLFTFVKVGLYYKGETIFWKHYEISCHSVLSKSAYLIWKRFLWFQCDAQSTKIGLEKEI